MGFFEITGNLVENVSNFSDAVGAISPGLLQRFETLVVVLQAAGIAFIVYIAYLIYRAIIDWKNRKRIKRLETKIDDIEKKLDDFLKSKKKS